MNRRSGFTLIEVLVALLFLAIVLPAIMKGISLATTTASDAQYRTEAAALAQSKLSELMAGQLWANGTGLSGDFSPDYPNFKYLATVQAWAGDASGIGLQQIDLTVSWNSRGHDNSVTLSTIAYQRGAAE